MSTTATVTPTDSHEYRLGIPPEDAFDELAFYSPEVCSRCFSRIRTHDTYRPDVGLGGVSEHAPTERLRRAWDGGKGYKIELVDDYGYRPLHEPRTFCEECGSQSGRADDDTLSQRQAVTFASNLLNRLHEANVLASKRALKHLVKGLKSDARVTDYDTEIFRRATKVAIRRARHRIQARRTTQRR